MKILLTVDEAASLLSVSRSTCYRMIRDGELATVRWGRVLRVPRVAVEALVARWLEQDGLSDLAARLLADGGKAAGRT